MIVQLREFPENVVAFAGRGQVTKADYVSTLVPAVETALAGRDRLRLYYELGADFVGIDAEARRRLQDRNAAPLSLGTGRSRHRRPMDRPCDFTLRLSDAGRDQGLFDESR